MKSKKSTKSESAALWNIAINFSVRSINDEASEKEFEITVEKFRKKLDEIITSKLKK